MCTLIPCYNADDVIVHVFIAHTIRFWNETLPRAVVGLPLLSFMNSWMVCIAATLSILIDTGSKVEFPESCSCTGNSDIKYSQYLGLSCTCTCILQQERWCVTRHVQCSPNDHTKEIWYEPWPDQWKHSQHFLSMYWWHFLQYRMSCLLHRYVCIQIVYQRSLLHMIFKTALHYLWLNVCYNKKFVHTKMPL